MTLCFVIDCWRTSRGSERDHRRWTPENTSTWIRMFNADFRWRWLLYWLPISSIVDSCYWQNKVNYNWRTRIIGITRYSILWQRYGFIMEYLIILELACNTCFLTRQFQLYPMLSIIVLLIFPASLTNALFHYFFLYMMILSLLLFLLIIVCWLLLFPFNMNWNFMAVYSYNIIERIPQLKWRLKDRPKRGGKNSQRAFRGSGIFCGRGSCAESRGKVKVEQVHAEILLELFEWEDFGKDEWDRRPSVYDGTSFAG